jgi:hypothetical protein
MYRIIDTQVTGFSYIREIISNKSEQILTISIFVGKDPSLLERLLFGVISEPFFTKEPRTTWTLF